MSFVVRHAGQGAAYDFDGARFVMKASGAETVPPITGNSPELITEIPHL